MNTSYVLFLTLLTAPGLVLPLGAQVVNDGATGTLSNVTNNITGTVTVGTNGAFTLLVLADNALLTNSANGVISANATARSNEVRLASPSARWLMGGNLFVGSNGAASRLIVSNGALVENNNGILGSRLESSNNVALVTGGGSMWSNRNNLDIGGSGRDNQMIVSNGGWVASRNVRVGANTTSSNNLVLVTGSGSVWSNVFALTVGNTGPGNRLVIEAGGLVNDDTGTVGDFGSASNNEALVTGPGSLWINLSSLTIGHQIGRNRLVVSNGASVWSGNGVVSTFSNQVVVTGAGSVWSNQTFLVLAGGSNRVDVSNGGWLVNATGDVTGNSNTVMLTGSGSGWNNSDSLLVGDFGNDNTFIASNGATVLSSNAFVGSSTSLGNNNLAIITGAGTLWNNRNDLTVGNFSAGNRLVATNGATVTTSNLFVGFQSSASNNRVSVDGGTLHANLLDVRHGTAALNAGLMDVDLLRLTNAQGQFEFKGGTLVSRGAFINNGSGMIVGASGSSPSVWDVRAGVSNHFCNLGVIVGFNTAFHQLLVTDGALLTNGIGGFIGLSTGANSNQARISGSGSQWRTSGDLSVGSVGTFNRLVVSDAGWVVNSSGLVGQNAGASNNAALVTGSGSMWSNRLDLTVGVSGPGNQLVLSNGALVANRIGNLGQQPGSSNNLVVVTGNGSYWSNQSDLNVGVDERGNRLIIEAGGLVNCDNGRVGAGVFGSGNKALVTGPGSLWSSRSDLAVGLNAGNNLLVVSNGGAVVSSQNGRVGASTPATGNQVLVTGRGSLWSNQLELHVGEASAGNRLEVSSGGWVVNSNAYVGSGGSSNLALLTGAGTLWSNRNDFVVGNFSAGNRLDVNDGGRLVTGSGIIGSGSTANSNTVVLTDNNSVWNNLAGLIVGDSGSGNTFIASNGATVLSSNATIGASASLGNNNFALLTGAGTLWSNRNNFTLGNFSFGNRLVASSGATIFTGGNAVLGRETGANSNSAWVTGPGTRWLVASNLYVGSNGAFNLLVVSNSGAVFGGNIVVGAAASATNNRVVVDGGTLRATNLFVGSNGAFNLLVVSNSGTVSGGNVVVGVTGSAINNRVVVDGGVLLATNAAGTGVLDVRRGTNALNTGLVDVDQLVLTNKGTIPIPNVFGNSSSNHVSATGNTGPASVYPSTIAVAGLAGLVTKVSVTLSNLTHFIPRELDILLVSPGGQKVMLMSDAGGGVSISNVRLIFDDTAATLLPDSDATDPFIPITSGTYRPTDYEPGDTMPSPAPAGPYSTSLSSFNGINPNGDWSLYITDDSGGVTTSTDSLVGWGLQIEIEDLFFDPAVFEFNGGTLITRGASINNGLPFIVGGPGGIPAIWDARAGSSGHFVAKDLIVGDHTSFNQLLIPGGSVVAVGKNVLVGRDPATSINNLLHVTGGTLRVLNPGTMLDVRGGTNRLDAGLVDVSRLVVTNTRGQFEFNGGTLRTPDTTVANGRVFTVGNGASSATLQLSEGTHVFSNNLVIANNASLIGNGAIDGILTVSGGGRLIPGAPIGRISSTDTVILQGTVNLQIDKSGAVLTNDQVAVDGAIIYGGTLTVADIGTDALAAGDRFPLFDAAPFVGSFATITLPPLGPGLSWQNNLLVDGSIKVIATRQPGFSGIRLSGTNVIIAGTNGTPGASYAVLTATNVALPLTNWVSLVTNQFGSGGAFSFTNGIRPGELQRFFQLEAR